MRHRLWSTIGRREYAFKTFRDSLPSIWFFIPVHCNDSIDGFYNEDFDRIVPLPVTWSGRVARMI